MTLDEVTDYISQDLEDWQKEANRKWLKTIWGALKMGAIWYYPLDASMWKKTEEGFDRIKDVSEIARIVDRFNKRKGL